MSKNLLANFSWWHGQIFTNATQTGNSGTTGGTAVANYLGRPGYVFRGVNQAVPATRGGYDVRLGNNALGGVDVNDLVARVYVEFENFPLSGDTVLLMALNNVGSAGAPTQGFPIRVLPSGQVEAGYIASTNWVAGALSNAQLSTMKLCPGRRHRVDAYLNSRANMTMKWMVNGVPQADVVTTQPAAFWGGVTMHYRQVILPIASQIAHSHDLAVSSTPSDYPIGPGRTVMLRPNANNHSVIVTSTFAQEDGAPLDANSWQRVATGFPPMGNAVTPAASDDGLSIRATAPMTLNNYVEFQFDDLPALLPGESVSCVHLWASMYRSATTPGGSGMAGDVYVQPGNELIRADTMFGNSATVVLLPGSGSANVNNIPAPAGGWTEAKVNSLSLRWRQRSTGGTASTFWGLSALLLEVHLTSDDEFSQIGCPQEAWGTIAK